MANEIRKDGLRSGPIDTAYKGARPADLETEMVERVARALCDDTLARWRSPIGVKSEPWREFIPAARAAIEAMKLVDPQEGVPGGISFEDTLFGEADTIFHAMRNAWNATIDAALKDEPSASSPTS